MARKAREKSSTGIYHILLRANNKLFLNDADKDYFVSLAGEYFRDGVSIYGYRTENERVHIVLKEHTKTISEAIKGFCTSYARYFNRVHSIDGKLFDGRFKSEPIETDKKLSEVLGYLYRDNAETFKKDEIINHDEIKKIKLKKGCLAMDDYTAMTDKELSAIIGFLCGDKLKNLNDEEKIEAVMSADKDSRLRSGMIKQALNIKNNAGKKTTAKKQTKKAVSVKPTQNKHKKSDNTKEENEKIVKKPEETKKQTKKQELPVWLL